MNVPKELTVAIRAAQIQLEAIGAPVVLVIVWQVIGKHAVVSINNSLSCNKIMFQFSYTLNFMHYFSYIKILMNVLKILMVVLRHVQTQLVAILVHVVLAIA